MEPPVWHNLVVRLWRDGDDLKVRFLASENGRRPATSWLATSVESAARQFEDWLRSIDDDARPSPSTLRRRRGRQDDDDAATDPQTAGS